MHIFQESAPTDEYHPLMDKIRELSNTNYHLLMKRPPLLNIIPPFFDFDLIVFNQIKSLFNLIQIRFDLIEMMI